MPKYELYKSRRSNKARTVYDQSKQVTRLENKINELRRMLQKYLG